MKMHVLVIGAVVVLLGSGFAWGDLVDQQQLSGPTNIANFSNSGMAQSFMPSVSSISGASLMLASYGTQLGKTADVTISLYEDLPGSGGVPLATGMSTVLLDDFHFNPLSDPLSDLKFLEVPFTTPVSVIPESTYFLDFSASSTGSLASFYLRGIQSSPYDRGRAYEPGYISRDWDYAFKTHVVPVPSAVLLGILGLGSARAFLRRRRKAGIRMD